MTNTNITVDESKCIYSKTCLHKKEKTRDCLECVHYNNIYEQQILALENSISRYESKLTQYRQALEEIKKLNEECSDCTAHTACGVCSAASGKAYNSYKIANEVLND